MELPNKVLKDLFDQLGLDSGERDIERFIEAHRPLPDDVKLTEAPFWSPSQARFLREEIMGDAEWAPPVDQLNVLLRAPRETSTDA